MSQMVRVPAAACLTLLVAGVAVLLVDGAPARPHLSGSAVQVAGAQPVVATHHPSR